MKNSAPKYETGFVAVEKILPIRTEKYKLQPAYARHRVLKFWPAVAAGFLVNSESLTKATEFKNGVLVVACLSQELAYQIKILANRIIYALNQQLGKNLVFAICVET